MKGAYISVDVETDGPIPGPNSLLSLGAAAFVFDANMQPKMIDTFQINFECLSGASGNPETMAWWATQPDAWNACRANPIEPRTAMQRFVAWVDELPGKPVFVGYPAGFDFLFVYWYLIQFTGRSPFSFSALDIKTLAMSAMRCDYRDAVKRNMPKHWFSKKPHTHQALDDAIEQGELFCNIIKDLYAN